MSNKNKRPVFLDLRRIRLPVTAVTSLAHRISGLVLFLALPFCIYLLDRSLSGPDGFAVASSVLDAFAVRLLFVAVLWALAHHILAGIRFLLLDLDWGAALPEAVRSARAVNLAGLTVAVLAGGWLLL